ncbi:MAG TPA: substrate-binding domain-containing protein, partial [Solirubrobacterales bacterium]
MRNAREVTRRRGVKAAPVVALLTLLIAVLVAGCGSSSDDASSSSGGGKLDVVGYSTPEAVYQEDLEPAFEKTSAGSGVSYSNSFGASGDQSRAVVAGQPASVVHFAQAGDMERLVEEGGLVAKDWDKQQYGGIAQDSVVVISVRKGNPEGIQTLDDVLSKDVDVVTPNPFSSGAARWNIMAVYGTLINEGSSPDEALAGVKTLLEKTVAQPGSARDALAAFTQGEGDVLLGYENEAIKAEEEGEDLEYVVPPSTI